MLCVFIPAVVCVDSGTKSERLDFESSETAPPRSHACGTSLHHHLRNCDIFSSHCSEFGSLQNHVCLAPRHLLTANRYFQQKRKKMKLENTNITSHHCLLTKIHHETRTRQSGSQNATILQTHCWLKASLLRDSRWDVSGLND